MPQASKSLSFHQKSPEWLVLHGFDTLVFLMVDCPKSPELPCSSHTQSCAAACCSQKQSHSGDVACTKPCCRDAGMPVAGKILFMEFYRDEKEYGQFWERYNIVWIVADHLIDRNQIRILRNPKPIFGHNWQLILHSSFFGFGRFGSMFVI